MSDDTGFLGETFTVMKLGKEKHASYWNAKPEDVKALRTALDRAFAALEPGVFYRLESVVSHLAFGEHNPVNVGLAPEQVAVFHHSQPIPAAGGAPREGGPVLDRGLREASADPAGRRPGRDRRRGEGLHRARTPPRRVFRPRGAPGGAGPGPGRRGAGGGAAGFQRDRHRPEPGRRRRAGAVLRAGQRGRRPGGGDLQDHPRLGRQGGQPRPEARRRSPTGSGATPATRCPPTCCGRSRTGPTGCAGSPPRR